MPQLDDPRHNLRLPADLKKKLAHSAVDNGRSMNAEILARLEASFAPAPIREIENLLKTITTLDEDDRAEAFSLLARASDILARR
ncbi:Arc family DNA-binding protein [Rhizobium leguminosarum]|uniref:Arc family DNA-binding protein n=1 Tax=Rhizobium leguminosarum TaxID=384 RepID=UPI0013BCAC98|nr:Arc family DNA-binding protein [Rhizobium leguminosarum]NEI60945.1 Arc family DNA-binding protein [Rhizobium leguminosarum]